ncbi:MAG TPA: methyltransferase domain-containing protein, partial [Candidatus Binataceae bacterium]
TRFLDFAGHGYGRGEIVCPGCGSHPRHRGLTLILGPEVKKLRLRERVLHLAPERAITPTFALRPDLIYVGADLAMPSAAITIRVDVNRMPFRADAFAMLVCSHMLEHLADDAAALREITRVLSKGASAFLMVPMLTQWESLPTEEFSGPNPLIDMHYRAYGADLKDRIECAGLECSLVRFSDVITGADRELCGIGDDVVFIGEKP